jgi:hypothetical protein
MANDVAQSIRRGKYVCRPSIIVRLLRKRPVVLKTAGNAWCYLGCIPAPISVGTNAAIRGLTFRDASVVRADSGEILY